MREQVIESIILRTPYTPEELSSWTDGELIDFKEWISNLP